MRKFASSLKLVFTTWPIRPWPLVVVLTLFQVLVNFAIVIATARAIGRRPTPLEIYATMPALAYGIIFGLAVLFSVRKLSALKPRWSSVIYWLGAVLFGVSMGFARLLSLNDYSPEYWRDSNSFVRIFIATSILYLTVHISLGVSSLKLAEQAKAAELARASLEIQRGKLISAQEDVRRQIADFLHDRLQSDLVLLGMQMQRFTEKLGDQNRSVAQAYIDEIERIRQFDIRSVSKQLAPELSGISIKPALEDLAAPYSSVMKIELKIDEQGKLSQTAKLACYRIVEQALLNSAKHGKADQVSIEIRERVGTVEILVSNNGEPVSKSPVAGAGFAIVDNWVAQFDGRWSISSDQGRTNLAALLKLK